MVYQNPWNEGQPQGTAAATTLDDIIRQLKVDIRERMESLVTDWDADPVVPIGRVGIAMVLGPESLVLDYDLPSGYAPTDDIVNGAYHTNKRGFVVLPLQSGWRVTKVEALVNKDLASALTLTLEERLFNTSQFGAGSYGPVSHGGSGVSMVTIYSNSPGFSVSNQSGWTVVINASTPTSSTIWQFYGVRVTYNAPNG